jgi:KaiC/GvpD/RAD55 family RecA-like ATPase
LGAAKLGQIFGRASDKPRAVTINSFAAVPKIQRDSNHNRDIYGAAFASDIKRGLGNSFARVIYDSFSRPVFPKPMERRKVGIGKGDPLSWDGIGKRV